MALLSNEVVLRPRFRMTLEIPDQEALTRFEENPTEDFVISRVNHHVFIRIPKAQQHYWSPQLHLEIEPEKEDTSSLRGLFGPNPNIWTLFMFGHFGVATIFIIFGIWAYSNWSLGNDFVIQVAVMFFMLTLWVVLYFLGRMGRDAGKDQMHLLYDFMRKTLGLED